MVTINEEDTDLKTEDVDGLVIEYDIQGTNFIKYLTPKDCFQRSVNLGHFLLNQSHPLFDHIKPIVFGKYKVRMKFIQKNPSGSIYINGRWLCMRKSKFSPVYLGKGVKLIEGTPFKTGGSNAHPHPTFKEGYCILEFTSFGLPMTDPLLDYQWTPELISLELINKI